MIKLNKGPKPNILAVNQTNWTSEYLGYSSKGEKVPSSLKNKYNNKEIKDALKEECSGKCMYCESPIEHITPAHIEHIKAKSKHPNLIFEWENLGLSCPNCNIGKGDYDDLSVPLINPYQDNPADFFCAAGNLMYVVKANLRGLATIRILSLNRAEIVERRRERLQLIAGLINEYHKENNLVIKKALKKEIEIEIGNDKPYSFFTNALFKILM